MVFSIFIDYRAGTNLQRSLSNIFDRDNRLLIVFYVVVDDSVITYATVGIWVNSFRPNDLIEINLGFMSILKEAMP